MVFETLIQECKLRNYSKQTIKAYLYHNKKFLSFISKIPHQITNNDIRTYLLHLQERRLSSSTINLAHNALTFYYTKMMKRNFKSIAFQKRESKRPYCPTQNEVIKMINATDNIKHKIIISLLYSSGLRREELQNLKIQDIEFDKKLIRVKQGKGKKDRITIIANKTLELIKEHLKSRTIKSPYLLSGRNGKYSTRSIMKVVTSAVSKAKLSNNITPHSLRHAFATSHLKNNTQTEIVQRMLGHKDIRTTRKYLHLITTDLENLQSPLDI